VSLVSALRSPVILSAAGVPAGILVNFSNNYLTPTQTVPIMTFTALPSAVNGVYTITVLASSGSTIKTLTYTLTIYDYGLSLSSAAATLNEFNLAPNVTIATSTITIGNPAHAAHRARQRHSLRQTYLTVSMSALRNPNIAVPVTPQ
jgi:hypothetical protein